MAENKAPRNNAHCTLPDDAEQSTYRFIIVAAKRARQLQSGQRSVLPAANKKPTNSVIGCWFQGAGCTLSTGPFVNVSAAGPWDTAPSTGQPTLTTDGNNATTHEAWGSPLTPGGFAQAPVEPKRKYTEQFTDAWNDSKCDPSNLHPGGNDINPVVTNLFVSHNRMHDYAYYLGFTERHYNMQKENFSRGGVQGDPEVGNVQAGALTGGQGCSICSSQAIFAGSSSPTASSKRHLTSRRQDHLLAFKPRKT